MLKKRLIAVLVVKNGLVVQSIGFRKYLPIGKPDIAVDFLNSWGIDEIVVLDIDASVQKRGPDFAMIEQLSRKNFTPLSIGGGISSVAEMKKVIHFGAEKIVINKAALQNPELISQAVDILGRQSVIVSVDVKKLGNKYFVFSDSGSRKTSLEVTKWVRKIEELGAGEIFLNSIDRDGTKMGYDLALIKLVSRSVTIPVIVCGGAGQPKHFVQAFENGVVAVAAGNFFHFTEHSPVVLKAFMKSMVGNVRIETNYDYDGFEFLADGRIAKKSEAYLDKIRFEYQAKEII